MSSLLASTIGWLSAEPSLARSQGASTQRPYRRLQPGLFFHRTVCLLWQRAPPEICQEENKGLNRESIDFMLCACPSELKNLPFQYLPFGLYSEVTSVKALQMLQDVVPK